MERLTERDEHGDIYVKNQDYISASRKLADYEDTGLEPEDIPTGIQMANIFCMQISCKRMKELLEEAAETIENCYGKETDLTISIRKEIN